MKNIPPNFLIIGVLIILGVGYKIFFVDSGEVREFNDSLVDMISKDNLNFTKISKNLNDYDSGKKINIDAMKKIQVQLLNGLQNDVEGLNRMEVPENDNCKKFHKSCLDYAVNSVDIAKQYDKIIIYISSHNPGTPVDSDIAFNMLKELRLKDDKLFKTITSAQQALAREFDFELK